MALRAGGQPDDADGRAMVAPLVAGEANTSTNTTLDEGSSSANKTFSVGGRRVVRSWVWFDTILALGVCISRVDR